MKRHVLVSVALLLSQAALAEGSLDGRWVMSGLECSSGVAKSNAAGGLPEGEKAPSLEFSGDRLTLVTGTKVTWEQGKAAEALRQAESIQSQLRGIPDSPNKQEIQKKLDHTLGWTLKFRDGVWCDTTVVYAYTLSGSKLQVTRALENTSSCAFYDRYAQGVPKMDGKVDLNGDQLRITSLETAGSYDTTCPANDHKTLIFSRAK